MPKSRSALNGPDYRTFNRRRLIQECHALREGLHRLGNEINGVHLQLQHALNVTLNNPHIQGEFNNDMLVSLLDQIQNEGEVDFEGLRLDKLLEKIMSSSLDDAHSTLAERFGVPPFSVLDARQGYWQDRKRAWIALGIKSELGRGGDLLTLAPAEQARSRWKL